MKCYIIRELDQTRKLTVIQSVPENVLGTSMATRKKLSWVSTRWPGCSVTFASGPGYTLACGKLLENSDCCLDSASWPHTPNRSKQPDEASVSSKTGSC
jgi:hypothetical protein